MRRTREIRLYAKKGRDIVSGWECDCLSDLRLRSFLLFPDIALCAFVRLQAMLQRDRREKIEVKGIGGDSPHFL